MVKFDLQGVHTVRAKLASGKVVTYHYAWRGGPRLEGKPGSPAFHASYNAAHAARKVVPPGTLHALIVAYRNSSEFKGRAESSKRAYRAYLALIEDEFRDMTLEAVQDKRARGDFKEWRDSMSATPRKADYAWSVLARVLAFAKDRGKISVNVCEKGGRIYTGDRKDVIWSDDQVAAFAAKAPRHLRQVMNLALWTGQRQGDLLTMEWTAYDGRHIRVSQSKTKANVSIPIHATLRAELDATSDRSGTILKTTDGTEWTSSGFRASWRKACAKAGVKGVTFHDLRGTAVVALALSGCTVPEIVSITGHSLADAEAILNKHYLGRDVRLAEAAMAKREAHEKRNGDTKKAPDLDAQP
ncbi:tyrosine-type recombinase/integrase [Methylobacterium sp. E-005]|uniref:tyrosine-type recombinase/integrase n=1 Tax=Methylobacterium sp. E-005 TaxID=2836549 RepID=UPI001FBA7B9A|nr:site-specific integrase [Methylobacterium sp. E-005]MCJ2084517.1 tyrosine-type recombinase/integrase [Methylobacterium sp. E-005]